MRLKATCVFVQLGEHWKYVYESVTLRLALTAEQTIFPSSIAAPVTKQVSKLLRMRYEPVDAVTELDELGRMPTEQLSSVASSCYLVRSFASCMLEMS